MIKAWLARRREARKSSYQRKLEWVQENYPRAWVNENLDPRYRNEEDMILDGIQRATKEHHE